MIKGQFGLPTSTGILPGAWCSNTLSLQKNAKSSESDDLTLRSFSGYTFQTSQYGLALDNIVSFDIVLPTGEIKTVTSDDEDLFFAVRVSIPP